MNLIANARMYAVTPEAAVAWKQMFSWLSNHSGVPLEIVDHASPAPLEEFWSRHDLGCAFMCGFPFAKSSPRLTAAAAPIPSDARYGGCSVYSTELVVRADSKCRILDETFGGRVGFTVDHSHSGFDALRHHLLHLRSAARSALYATSVGPLFTPQKVIDALLADEIDVGPLDSFVLDLIGRHAPQLAARLRVIASTDLAPIPLLVASPQCPDDVVSRLRNSLIAFGGIEACATLRDELCLAGFSAVVLAEYDLTLAWESEAVAAGYAFSA